MLELKSQTTWSATWLKDNSKSIRFLMMTGVTKLTKLSVFSGLNHLTDVSMDPRFATLLGYTPEELDGTLRENVEKFGAMNGWDFPTAKAKLLDWYLPASFSKSPACVESERFFHSRPR